MPNQILRTVPQRQTCGASVSSRQCLPQDLKGFAGARSNKARPRMLHRKTSASRQQPQVAKEGGVSEDLLEGAASGSRGWSQHHVPNNGSTSGRPVLGRSNGARFPRAVGALQEALMARGFPCRDEAGVFGWRTEVALKGLQAAEGLLLTGLLDDATMDALMATRGSEGATGEPKRQQQQQEEEEEHEGGDLYRLRCFWKDEGLSNSRHIHQLVQAVRAAEWPHAPARDKDILLAQLQRLRRLLPGADVLVVAVREPRVLDADMGEATRNLLLLLEALPGQDVQGAVAAFPAVLLMEDLGARLNTTLERLREWTEATSSYSSPSPPSYLTPPPMSVAPSTTPLSPLGANDDDDYDGCSSSAAVHRVLVDNLGLLLRVPDRHAEASLSDLPIDLQRTIIAASCHEGAAASEHHQRHISVNCVDDGLAWPM